MAKVIFQNVYKKFDNNTVIQDLNVEIKDREFVVIVGPSGCGKSTSLRMIAGLETVTEGRILIGDRVVNDVPPKDRDIAMVFQNYALYPHMDVYRNMAFGLKLRKFPKEEIDKRVTHAAEILGIQDLLERKPKQLSGGQRQRVAVGRAIVREPSVFLFDEPLSNLDAKLRVQMRSEIKKLHMKLRATMVYVTHDQVEAMTMGDRIVILKDGILQQQGSPMEIYRHPSNQFVAGFIGSPAMNFLKCTLQIKADKIYCIGEDFEIALPENAGQRFDLKSNSQVIFGIRPEDLFIDRIDSKKSDQAFIQGDIELVETTGSEILVHALVGKEEFVARINSDISVKSGEHVKFAFPIAKMHLFDGSSQESLWQGR